MAQVRVSSRQLADLYGLSRNTVRNLGLHGDFDVSEARQLLQAPPPEIQQALADSGNSLQPAALPWNVTIQRACGHTNQILQLLDADTEPADPVESALPCRECLRQRQATAGKLPWTLQLVAAACPHTPPAQLAALAESTGSTSNDLAHMLAANPSLPTQDANRFTRSSAAAVRQSIAAHPNIGRASWQTLAHEAAEHVRAAACQSHWADQTHLLQAADDEHPAVRATAAARLEDPEVLQGLTVDNHPDPANAALRRLQQLHLPVAEGRAVVLQERTRAQSVRVRTRTARLLDLPDAALRQLLDDPHPQVAAVAARHPQTLEAQSTEVVRRLAYDLDRDDAVQTAAELLLDLPDAPANLVADVMQINGTARRLLLAHPNAPTSMLRKAADGRWGEREVEAVASNPNVPWQIQQIVARTWAGRPQLAANPACDPRLLDKWSANPQLSRAVLRNPNASLTDVVWPTRLRWSNLTQDLLQTHGATKLQQQAPAVALAHMAPQVVAAALPEDPDVRMTVLHLLNDDTPGTIADLVAATTAMLAS